MNTPIVNFVRNYAEKNMSRLHMPGHKGQSFLGCERFDITEVSGADALYEAEGIIAESEANAASLFGTERTVYSTEGSSQCIRAMLYLSISHWKAMHSLKQSKKDIADSSIVQTGDLNEVKETARPVIVAARNVHKAFVYAAALLDFDIVWLWPEKDMYSICGCPISIGQLENTLKALQEPPAAVYVTSPDYLGGQQDIAAFAKICHDYGTILAVDNAHGAYLHFTEQEMHPIDLGADICCDSAHKTLPVLTGGAYLQINKNAPGSFAKNAKSAMALFGSTSPSYLILSSLDLCNQYLADGYKDQLKHTCEQVQELRDELEKNGWQCEGMEPLKLTVRMPDGLTGTVMAARLRECQIECEFSDPENIVFMFTPENEKEDYQKIRNAFGKNSDSYSETNVLKMAKCQNVMSVRESIFAEHEEILVTDAKGRICGTPTVSCPPAIPIVVSGEVIDDDAIVLFEHYGIKTVDVVKEYIRSCY